MSAEFRLVHAGSEACLLQTFEDPIHVLQMLFKRAYVRHEYIVDVVRATCANYTICLRIVVSKT
jgi:hypothetical protein